MGPFGTSKTRMAEVISTLHAMQHKSVFTATASNAAADAVIDKFTDVDHLVVRFLPLGLTKREIKKKGNIKKPRPSVRPQVFHDPNTG